MANKLSLNDVSNLQDESSAVAQINANFTAIESAFDNTLSRDGTFPNSLDDDIDMNSKRILNLPEAVSNTEPVRKAEFDEFADAVGNAPTILAEALDAQTVATAAAAAAAQSAIDAAQFDPSSYLAKSDNLAALTSVTTARTNLGVYSSAETDTLVADYIPVADKALYGEVRSKTGGKVMEMSEMWTAAAPVGIAYAATITLDFATGFNFAITPSGDFTLANPDGMTPGQAGYILLDGTWTGTPTFGSYWKFPAGMSKTKSAGTDVIFYMVHSTSFILCSLVRGYE